jgi:hypothetical protein
MQYYSVSNEIEINSFASFGHLAVELRAWKKGTKKYSTFIMTVGLHPEQSPSMYSLYLRIHFNWIQLTFFLNEVYRIAIIY